MEPHLARKDLELFIKEADSAGNGQVKYEGTSSEITHQPHFVLQSSVPFCVER